MSAAVRRMGQDADARFAVLTNALRPLSAVQSVTFGRYLVKGLLDRGAFSVVYGPSNIGKSFFALDLAIRVSAGIEWFGRRVAKGAGPAVYICAEGMAAFGNRIEALRRINPDLVAEAEDAGMLILPTALNLCKGCDAKLIVAMIKDTLEALPSLIVIDTLARSMGEGSENDSADMAAVIASAGLLQSETGAHVLVVHHNGKDQARGMRGHSNLRAAIDTEIELTRSGSIITADARKQRDMAFGQPVHFTLRSIDIGEDEDGDLVTSAVLEQVNAPDRGAIAGNDDRRREAAGRADAALRLIPTDGEFAASDAATIFVSAGIIKTDKPKSAAEMTRRMLRKMAEAGQLVALDDGKFRACGGAR